MDRCDYCSKPGVSLAKCSGCHSSAYCGSNCQKAHWGQHRLACKRLAGLWTGAHSPAPVFSVFTPSRDPIVEQAASRPHEERACFIREVMASASGAQRISIVSGMIHALEPELVELCLSFGLVSTADDHYVVQEERFTILKIALNLGACCFASTEDESKCLAIIKAVLAATAPAALNRIETAVGVDNWPITPLFFACSKGYPSSSLRDAVVRLLLEHGASATQPGLAHVAIENSVETLKQLLDAGADTTHCDEEGSVLHRLVYYGMNNAVDKVALLLASGAPLEAVDSQGMTALQLAFISPMSSQEAITALLAAGADTSALGNRVRSLTGSDWEYTIHLVASAGHVACMQRLLDPALLPAGVIDVNARISAGYTALHIAAMLDHADICSVLVAAGADLKVRHKVDDFPFSTAVSFGSYKAAKALAKAGAAKALSKRDVASLIKLVRNRLSDPDMARRVVELHQIQFGSFHGRKPEDIEKGWANVLPLLKAQGK